MHARLSLALLAALLISSTARAQLFPTTVTYQGVLSDAGSPGQRRV